jgi:hypothetical protein
MLVLRLICGQAGHIRWGGLKGITFLGGGWGNDQK